MKKLFIPGQKIKLTSITGNEVISYTGKVLDEDEGFVLVFDLDYERFPGLPSDKIDDLTIKKIMDHEVEFANGLIDESIAILIKDGDKLSTHYGVSFNIETLQT